MFFVLVLRFVGRLDHTLAGLFDFGVLRCLLGFVVRVAFCLIVFGLKIWVLLNVLDGIYVCICV